MSLNEHGFQNRSYIDEEEDTNSGGNNVPPKTSTNGKDKHAPPSIVIVPDIKIELDPSPGHVTFTPDTKTNGHSGQNGSSNNGHVDHFGNDR